jgi:H+/gluconate symporter-like permease
MVGFIKLYFPVFLLGAAFGKLMEVSGFVRSIIDAVLRFIGPAQAMFAVVLVCAILTYGGVSLFVVAFAVYPFAAELFRSSNIPKRLLPATIALGAFAFTMDALPGSPQIQNIIPTTFFGTDSWAAPALGVVGSLFLLTAGMGWLEWSRRRAFASGEGYGTEHMNEPAVSPSVRLPHPLVAAAPLLLVGIRFCGSGACGYPAFGYDPADGNLVRVMRAGAGDRCGCGLVFGFARAGNDGRAEYGCWRRDAGDAQYRFRVWIWGRDRCASRIQDG